MPAHKSEALRLHDPQRGDVVPLVLSAQQLLALVQDVAASPHKTSLTKKLLPIFFAGSLLLASCSAIDTTQISSLQGSISGLGDTGLHNAGFISDFQYNSGFTPMVDQARQNYSEDQIRNNLKDAHVQTNVRIANQSGNVQAQLTRQDSPDTQELSSPWRLDVMPTGDGAFQIVVEGQECIALMTGEQKCTTPVTAVLSGQADIHGPQVNLAPFGSAPSSQGLLLSGTIQDGPGGSGVVSAEARQCVGPDSYPLSLDGEGRFSLTVPPKLGENCFLVRTSDRAGNGSESPQQKVTYQMAVNPAIVQQPDGKLVIDVPTSNNLFSDLTLRIERCDAGNQCAPVVDNAAIKSGSPVRTPAISPLIGNNIFHTVVRDIFGNSADSSVSYQYDFNLTSQAGVNQDGSITVTARPKNNSLPQFTVQVSRCGDTNVLNAAPLSDGAYSASLSPNVGDNCLAATAIDAFGNTVRSETHANYGMDPGPIGQLVDYKDKAAFLYLFGNAPAPVNISSLTFSGTQPDWKELGKKKPFACEPKGEVVIDGQKWNYSFMCALPADAGDATVRMDFVDKWGHQYSVFYPGNTQMIADLRDKPPSKEFNLWLAQNIALFAGAIGSAVFTGYKSFRFADERKRKGRAKVAADLVLTGNRQVLEQYVRAPRRVFKVSAGEARMYREAVRSLELVRTGQLTEAVEVMGLLDAAGSPALAEVKRILLDSAMESVNRQFARIEAARQTHMLSQDPAHALIESVEKISKTSSWQQMSPRVAERALTYVSSFHTTTEAFSMNPREFLERQKQLLEKGAANQEGRKRMITLLCHWRQFTAAQEFIRHVPGPEKKAFTDQINYAIRETKEYFVGELLTAANHELQPVRHSHPVLIRRTLRGMRLSDELFQEFVLMAQIRQSANSGSLREGFAAVSAFMKQYESDGGYITRFATELAAGAVKKLGLIATTKDPADLKGELVSACTTIDIAQQASWWGHIPKPLRDQLGTLTDEILMVAFARERGFEEFIKVYGPSRLTSTANVKKAVSLLSGWRDYLMPYEVIKAYPVEADRVELQLWFEKEQLGRLRYQYIKAIRTGSSTANVFDASYRLPNHFRDQCEMLGGVEVAVRDRDYGKALTYAHGLFAAREGQEEAVLGTAEYMVEKIKADFAEIIAAKDPKRLADGRKDTVAEALLAFHKDPVWRMIRVPEKNILVRNADEIRLITASLNEPEVVFARGHIRAGISRPQFDAVIAKLGEWHNLTAVYACIGAYPDAAERPKIEAGFNNTYVRTLRSSYSTSLEHYGTYAEFFSSYRLPARLEQEFRQREQLQVALRKDDALGILNHSRQLVLIDPVYLKDLNSSIEAVLKHVFEEWSDVITTKNIAYLQGSMYRRIADFCSSVRHEPWWEHQLISGYRDLIMKQADELVYAALAVQGPAAFMSALGSQMADVETANEAMRVTADWGEYNVTWAIANGCPQPKERERLTGYFARDYLDPLKKRYLEAMEADFPESAAFLVRYHMAEPHKRELSDLREQYRQYLSWKENTLPSWRYAEFMTGDLKNEIMADVAKTCSYAMFVRNLPFKEAAEVAQRYFDVTYFVDGPYVPLFLGVSASDIAAARKANNVYPIVSRIKKSMISLLNTLDGYSQTTADTNFSKVPRKELVTAYVIHGMILTWFQPLKNVIAAMPTRGTGTAKETYAPVDKLVYTAKLSEDESRAYVELWNNWLFGLFNNSINGESADVLGSYDKLNIKPIIYYKGNGSDADKEDKANIYII